MLNDFVQIMEERIQGPLLQGHNIVSEFVYTKWFNLNILPQDFWEQMVRKNSILSISPAKTIEPWCAKSNRMCKSTRW